MKTAFLKVATICSAFILLALNFSCQKSISAAIDAHSGNSSVNIYLTDDPALSFDKLLLDIRTLEIKVEDNDQEHHENEHQQETDDNDNHGSTSGGWMNVSIRAGVYDILSFRNGLDTLLSTGVFSTASKLKKIRLTLGSNNSVVINGTTLPLTVKGNDNIIVIKIDESAVKINAGGTTHCWIDIDGGRSVSRHGNNFEFKASCKGFSKEKTAGIEGRVLPRDAAAVVMAINGTDTSSAKPSAEGEFKFIGLKAGNYKVLYHATANNYLDSTMNNVIVRLNEDTKLSTVTLHK